MIVVFPYHDPPRFLSGREKSKTASNQSLSSHRMILASHPEGIGRSRPEEGRMSTRSAPSPDHADCSSSRTAGPHSRPGAHPGSPDRVVPEDDGRVHPSPKCRSSTNPRSGQERSRRKRLSECPEAGWRKPLAGQKPSSRVLIIAANVEEMGRLADLTAANLDSKWMKPKKS